MWFASSTTTTTANDPVADCKHSSGTVLLAIAFATAAATTSAADATTTAAADVTVATCKHSSGTVLLAIAFATATAATSAADATTAAADHIRQRCDVSSDRIAAATIYWSRWFVAVRANVVRLIVWFRFIVTIQ